MTQAVTDAAGATADAIAQTDLDLRAGRTRVSAFPWRGQFSPQFAETLLRSYARPGDFVWDPFVGCGTVLFECARLGIAAHGTDINPAAVAMAGVAAQANVPAGERRPALRELGRAIREALRTRPARERGPAEEEGTETVRSDSDGDGDGESENAVLDRLAALRRALGNGPQGAVLDAFACRWRRIPTDASAVLRQWRAFAAFVLDLPFSSAPVTATLADARAAGVPDASADLVLTSPPYVNVMSYHQQHRTAMEAFGWHVLAAAPSEIGANRKNRGNRLLTVAQYCLDMRAALGEMRRACRPAGRVIVVVGRESNVMKTPFANSALVARLADLAGLEAVLRQERRYRNRFGNVIVEDVLHFRPRAGMCVRDVSVNGMALEVAMRALREAASRAPAGTEDRFAAALASLHLVRPSPVLDVSLLRGGAGRGRDDDESARGTSRKRMRDATLARSPRLRTRFTKRTRNSRQGG